jgi:hypothetical protein
VEAVVVVPNAVVDGMEAVVLVAVVDGVEAEVLVA